LTLLRFSYLQGFGYSQKRGFGTLPDKQKPKRRSVQVLTASVTVFANMVPLAYACAHSFPTTITAKIPKLPNFPRKI